MAKMTKQQTIIKYYELKGYKQIQSTSRKYITLEKPGQPDHKKFIGRNGAIRGGKNPSSSVSISWNIDYNKMKTIVEGGGLKGEKKS